MAISGIFEIASMGLIRHAFLLGFTSLSIQIIYVRMAVGFAGGNEIYLSIFYFFWLLFTGIGAIVIKRFNPARMFAAFGIFSLFFASFFYIAPKFAGLISGQIVPPWLYLFTVIISLLPVGIVNGGLFASIAVKYKGVNKSGVTYWSEAAGALAGGLIAALYYLTEGRDFSFLLAVAILCFIPLAKNKIYKNGVVIISIASLIFSFGDKLEDRLLKYRYSPLSFDNSVSGRLIRYDSVKTGDVTTLYSGGVKTADFPDNITGQETFYWPYLIKPDLNSVALVGAEKSMVDKFIPENIDRLYIYPDKNWRKLVDENFLPDEKNCLVNDPLEFFKKSDRKFDAIILRQGNLLSLFDRRLETEIFLNLCKKSISSDGIFSVSLSAYDGVWHDDLRKRINDIYSILGKIFKNTAFIPGENLTFICSDFPQDEITANRLIQSYNKLNIDSPYFTPSLISMRLNSFKVNLVKQQLQSKETILDNLAIGHGLSYFFHRFNLSNHLKKAINIWPIIVFIIILIIISSSLAGFNGQKVIALINILYFGSISFIIELSSIYYFQLSGGYLYIALGIIIGLFMMGMAGGAFLETYYCNRREKMPINVNTISIAALLIIGILLAVLAVVRYNQWILLVITSLAGFAGGLGFAGNARIFDRKPGLPYGIDIGGALIGAVCGLAVLSSVLNFNTVLAFCGGLGVILFATNLWLAGK